MEAQSPIGSKRPRKKARPPQAISEKLWETIKLACVGGMGFSECAHHFGVSPYAIMMRCKRHAWPIPARVQTRVESIAALQTARYKAQEKTREQGQNGEQALETVAQSWAEKGEQHRQLAFQFARDSVKAGLPIEDWRDADLADKVARRNAGLDNEGRHSIEINMALVNARLDAITDEQLPKDALPGMPGA